jgi:hypothetical protein
MIERKPCLWNRLEPHSTNSLLSKGPDTERRKIRFLLCKLAGEGVGRKLKVNYREGALHSLQPSPPPPPRQQDGQLTVMHAAPLAQERG